MVPKLLAGGTRLAGILENGFYTLELDYRDDVGLLRLVEPCTLVVRADVDD